MDFHPAPQTLGWFKDRYNEGSLTLKPPYQRKPVWAEKQKCYLIESILLKMPIPEIYVQEETDEDGNTKYGIVDGQQRIRTVLQFIGCDRDPNEQSSNKFSLEKLGEQSRWHGKTFEELSRDEKINFYGYQFFVRMLRTNDEENIRDMFRRLNKYLAPLKAQELRNATYQGPFIRLAERLADDAYWVDNRIVSPAQIRRMNDVEFVSELLIGALHGPQGGGSKIIDSYYAQLEEYPEEFPDQKIVTKLFEDTLERIKTIFPDIEELRWSNKTDFYSLFVAFASQLRNKKLPTKNVAVIKRRLLEFASEVDRHLADDNARVSRQAGNYARAHEKGANEKTRRGERHIALTEVIDQYFA